MITLSAPRGVTNIGGAKVYAAKFATEQCRKATDQSSWTTENALAKACRSLPWQNVLLTFPEDHYATNVSDADASGSS